LNALMIVLAAAAPGTAAAPCARHTCAQLDIVAQSLQLSDP
jgi:hypothetical protein